MKKLSIKKVMLMLLMLVSILSYGKDFWEKKSFNVNVVESSNINGRKKTKGYVMNYSNNTIKMTITSPNVNKGEVYIFSKDKKTIYYPLLKQTVTQKLEKEEANILNIFNKIKNITVKKTMSNNGEKITFTNGKLASIENGNYTVTFSSYTSSGGYDYPTKIAVKNSNGTINYNLSNLK